MRYLDPKADLTFKKVFGRHPDLLISLLNALLPLSDDEQIESVEYLQSELVPELYEHKNSIVDVLCKDVCGRMFCVEMQMEWTTAFKQRVLFNASKLYVTQAHKSERYSDLHPVYSLNLVNDIVEDGLDGEFIHDYDIVHDKHSDRVIEGLHFTFIELPKFKPGTMLEKRMAVLWLRFLTEISDHTKVVSPELLESPPINKALEEVKVTAFTEEELRAYDKFWDSVRTEKTLQHDSEKKGREVGRAEGRAEGLAEGRAEGKLEQQMESARIMLASGLTKDDVVRFTGLNLKQVEQLGL